MKQKKAQGLSMNVLIIAVIALVVLVIVIAVFSKQSGKQVGTINALSSCENQGGTCTTKEECTGNKQAFYKYGGCPKTEEDKAKAYCCLEQ